MWSAVLKGQEIMDPPPSPPALSIARVRPVFSPPATVLRAMVVSVSQIATYDQAKTSLDPYVNGFRQHLLAGMISALTFTTVSMPFDTVKTRVQQVGCVCVSACVCPRVCVCSLTVCSLGLH